MGLVERERLERDGRVVLLSLRPRDEKWSTNSSPRRIESERQMLDDLDDDEIDMLVTLLRRVTRNVE